MKNLTEALDSITTALININDRLNYLEGRFEGALEGQEITNGSVQKYLNHAAESIGDFRAAMDVQDIHNRTVDDGFQKLEGEMERLSALQKSTYDTTALSLIEISDHLNTIETETFPSIDERFQKLEGEIDGLREAHKTSVENVSSDLVNIRDEVETLRNHNEDVEPRLMVFEDRLGALTTAVKDVKYFAVGERMAVNQRFIKLEATEFDTSALSSISPTRSEVVKPSEPVPAPVPAPENLRDKWVMEDDTTPTSAEDVVEQAIRAFPNHDVVLIDEYLGIKDPDDDVDPITGMTRASIITPTDGDPPFDVADAAYHQLVEVIG